MNGNGGITAGEAEQGQELKPLGCTSDSAWGERTNNPNCGDDPGDEEEDE